MTHPTLGYANLRFDGDTRTHMPATPTATLCVACSAGNGPLSGDNPFPHDMDAAVDCPNCLQALESDWWMALMENERRTGETTSLTGTLDDVRAGAERLFSQADAVAEETLLGGGASLLLPQRDPAALPGHLLDGMLGLLDGMLGLGEWARDGAVPIPPALAGRAEMQDVREAFRQKLIDVASPVTMDVTQNYLFAEDKITLRVRRGDMKAYEHMENPVTPEKLADAVTSMWTQLQLAKPPPMQDIAAGNLDDMLAMARQLEAANDMVHRQVIADAMEKLNALPEDHPAPITSSVHAAIEAAQQELAKHPFDTCQRCNYDTHRCPGCGTPLSHSVEVCDDCNADRANDSCPPDSCYYGTCGGQTSDPPCGACCSCLDGCLYDGSSNADRSDKEPS